MQRTSNDYTPFTGLAGRKAVRVRLYSRTYPIERRRANCSKVAIARTCTQFSNIYHGYIDFLKT